MGSDFVEFILQRAYPGHTVHELQMTLPFVVYAGIVDDRVADRFVYPSRKVQRNLRIVEAARPGILIEYPQHLARLAQNSPDAIEKDRLTVGKMVENKSDGPLPRRICPSQVPRVEREVPERLVPGCFEIPDQFHSRFHMLEKPCLQLTFLDDGP